MSEPIRGFSFPFRIDPDTGGVSMESEDEKLRHNILHILMTNVGERMMRRDYGAGLRQLVHDPLNGALVALTQHQVARAISRHEPRVLLQDVRVTYEEGTLYVSAQYVIRRTRQTQKVSFPIRLGGL